MLTSLFGDLGPLNEPPGRGRRKGADTPPADFAATAILESTATEVNDRGQMVYMHTRDLFVVGSPAEAIRQHLAETRADLEGPTAPAVAQEEHRASDAAAAPAPQKVDAPLGGLDRGRLYRALSQLMQLEGILGCCAVDASTGLVLQAERAADAPDLPLELAAATHTEVLRAHRRLAGPMGTADRVEEIIVSQGPRHQVLRTLSDRPEVFLLAVLDKQRTNLALARFKIMEAEKSLG